MPHSFQSYIFQRNSAQYSLRALTIWLRALVIALWIGANGACATAQPRAYAVGSKTFTESVILGEIVTRQLRSREVETRHLAQLGGTRIVWNALLKGDIDAYPEYIGTIVGEILAGDSVRDDENLRRALAARGVGMTESLGFSNSYALGVTRRTALRFGLRTISDLRRAPALRLAFSNEFMDRRDGWRGLRARYRLPQTNTRGMEHDIAYRALQSGAIDATDVYLTDAEIIVDSLVILRDDQAYFPDYRAVILYRLDMPAAAVAGLRALEGAIQPETMRALNALAKRDKIEESAIASGWLAKFRGDSALRSGAWTDSLSASGLSSSGFSSSGHSSSGHSSSGHSSSGHSSSGLDADFFSESLGAPVWIKIVQRLWDRTVEHLYLTCVSLSLAILVAIPLGFAAARRERFGFIILGVAGAAQTIPSLALLALLVPLLGVGALPAMTALFLYSVLPILRSTASGLSAIPMSLKESAEVLGLPKRAQILRIELPLALPFILSGVKTSAALNVGTATLGALIGAGGYGQPIMTGIRLADTGLILEGALPAAALALAAQWAFDALERAVLPKGARAPRENTL